MKQFVNLSRSTVARRVLRCWSVDTVSLTGLVLVTELQRAERASSEILGDPRETQASVVVLVLIHTECNEPSPTLMLYEGNLGFKRKDRSC